MLCAICISMLQHDDSEEGDHHATFRHVVMAADLGCRICKYLCRLRDRFCASSTSDVETDSGIRFQYWRYESEPPQIRFLQEGSWLENVPVWLNTDLHVSGPRATPNWWPSFLEEVRNDLPIEPWRVRMDHCPRRITSTNTSDHGVLNLAAEWLKRCRGDHKTCKDMENNRNSNYCPPRLLDLGNLDSKICRLIVAEHTESLESVGYIALSHCWGESPTFLTLTSDNIEEFQREIPLEALPKSFSEAASVCRYLGFRYLWIDSLCIIQEGAGSEQDWQLHTTEMDRIYEKCALNLAISRAANAEEGAFTDRDPDFLQPAFVYAPITMNFVKPIDRTDAHSHVSDKENRKDEPSSTENQDASVGGTSTLVTVFAPLCDFQSALWNLPLQSRGWVFQERIMSPRTLHFGEDRIHWECREGYQNEYLPEGLPGSGLPFTTHYEKRFSLPITLSAPSMSSLSKDEICSLHQDWLQLASDYSSTRLTYPVKDKLVAITAIAKKFQRVLLDRYVAGFFVSELAPSLLWSNSHYFHQSRACRGDGWPSYDGWTEKIVLDYRRDSKYRAPSWSWASTNNLVHFHCASDAIGGLSDYQESKNIIANIVDVSVELTDHRNPFGQVSWAEIIIEAPMANLMSLDEARWPTRDGGPQPEIYDPKDQLVALNIFEEVRREDKGNIFYLHGLVLTPTGVGSYRRIGTYQCRGPPHSRYPMSRFERVTIKLV